MHVVMTRLNMLGTILFRIKIRYNTDWDREATSYATNTIDAHWSDHPSPSPLVIYTCLALRAVISAVHAGTVEGEGEKELGKWPFYISIVDIHFSCRIACIFSIACP